MFWASSRCVGVKGRTCARPPPTCCRRRSSGPDARPTQDAGADRSPQPYRVSIAELAAVRADDVAIGRLREHLDATRTAPNAAAFVDADVEFHLELARAAGNPVLKDILISIRALLQAWIRRAIDRDGGIEATMAEHAAILTAVEAHPAR